MEQVLEQHILKIVWKSENTETAQMGFQHRYL